MFSEFAQTRLPSLTSFFLIGTSEQRLNALQDIIGDCVPATCTLLYCPELAVGNFSYRGTIFTLSASRKTVDATPLIF